MFQFARLIASIALEGLAAVAHVILFLLRRRSQRGRIHALILGQAPRARRVPVTALLVVVPLLALGGGFLAGCGSTEPSDSPRHVGAKAYKSSFDKQLDRVGESLEFLFWTPGARASMESDLLDFGREDLGALRETFELWGW